MYHDPSSRSLSPSLSRSHASLHTHTHTLSISDTYTHIYIHPKTALVHIYAHTMWIYITLAINTLTHHDGTPEPEPVNGRYKVCPSRQCISVLLVRLSLVPVCVGGGALSDRSPTTHLCIHPFIPNRRPQRNATHRAVQGDQQAAGHHALHARLHGRDEPRRPPQVPTVRLCSHSFLSGRMDKWIWMEGGMCPNVEGGIPYIYIQIYSLPPHTPTPQPKPPQQGPPAVVPRHRRHVLGLHQAPRAAGRLLGRQDRCVSILCI